MLRMSNPIAVPSRYYYDYEGHRYNSGSAGDLYCLLQTKGLTLKYQAFYDNMIHHMCLELPKGTCTGDEEGDTYVKRLTWTDISGFLQAIIAVAKAGLSGEKVYVEASEADRRAFLCSTCSKNTIVTCPGCSGIILLANLFLNGRTVKDQAKLGTCRLCGCWLAAKVWCSKAVLSRILKKDFTYPDHCWNKDPS